MIQTLPPNEMTTALALKRRKLPQTDETRKNLLD